MALDLEHVIQERALQITTCPHNHRSKLDEFKTMFDHYELVQCQDCGVKFWVIRAGSQVERSLNKEIENRSREHGENNGLSPAGV